ncbi:MAG: alpha-amylase [Planctomycetes bacterium RBG_16_64_10]|nr:MAG: alpha-amylase [Planctomycetes bacterium RBG_16_64_10]
MAAKIRLALVLHDHQPVGNFDEVFEQAYQDSYRPLLDVLESYPSLPIALHTSGSLIEWLDARHPEYVDRLAELAARGRIEIVGGAFYEPILTMLSPRDRIGQIVEYTRWLKARLHADVHGMWVPERVWEQSLTSDLVDAGIQYTLLDDFHFKSGGLTQEELYGYYVTEDDGKVLRVLPGSERLRYLIPFAAPQETIDYLGGIAQRHPGSVLVLADDGEKFGVWPDTKKHVFDDGWLRRFFDLLVDNQSWLQVTTPAEILANVPPLGKVYLPEGSYREMTEWALPASQLVQYEQVRHELAADPRWPRIAPLVRGGLWRNFKRKYPEADEMYTRMQMVSRRLQAAAKAKLSGPLLDRARTELYRGQCNCSYWHGAFGGIYLPHLRHAVYHHLIAADNLLDEVAGRPVPDVGAGWVEASSGDFNLDARPEVRLVSDQLMALIAPSQGGQLYELDIRTIRHNLLATLARRPEAYHAKVLAGSGADGRDVASIHDRVVFKQQGLDKQIVYDAHPRKSLLDHFYDPAVTLDQVASGQATEQGDFPHGKYTARIRRNPNRVQVVLSRAGRAGGTPLTLTKGITIDGGSASLQIAYLLADLPPNEPLHFAVELNFAGLPANTDDRYFYDADRNPLGDLGRQLNLVNTRSLGLVDHWLGIDLCLTVDRPTGIWTFPIQSVNQSEGGFELVHQSVVVQPHWIVQADAQGQWRMSMTLEINTSAANRPAPQAAVVATP